MYSLLIKVIKDEFMYKTTIMILTIITVLLISFECRPTTYYVDATNGNDSNTGTSQAAPWKTISKVNNSQFQPGDFILFKRDKTWRGQLTVPSAGSNGNPITITSYGSGAKPIIFGSYDFDDPNKWEAEGTSNLWQTTETYWFHASMNYHPYGYVYDDGNGDVWVTISNGTNSLSSDWDAGWSPTTGRVYIYHGSGKPSEQTSKLEICRPKVNATQATIKANNKNYIVIDGISLRYASTHHIGIANSSNIRVQNCDTQYCWRDSIWFGNNASNIIISNNYVKDSGDIGINLEVSWDGGNYSMSNITVTGNTVDLSSDGGIKVVDGAWGSSGYSNILISNNAVTNSGEGIDADNWVGRGIFLGNSNSNSTGFSNVVVTGNYINNATFACIAVGGRFSQITDVLVKGNRMVNDANYTLDVTGNVVGDFVYNIMDNVSGEGTCTLRCIDASGDIKFYNNTICGNSLRTVYIRSSSGIEYKNNIAYNMTTDNWKKNIEIALSSNLDIEYNLYFRNNLNDAQGITVNGVNYTLNNFSSYTSSWGYDLHSMVSDPLFVDSGDGDFRLKAGSSCIDAGRNVSLAQDCVGTPVPQGAGVDIGAIEHKEDVTPPKKPEGLRIQ